MIVIDEDSPDAKVPQPQPQREAGEEMSESSQLVPPPAYSSTSYRTIYNAPLQFPQDVPTHPRERFPRGENARKRFLKAFAIAFGVWLLLTILVQSFADLDIDLIVRHKRTRDNKSGDKKTQPGKSEGGREADGRIRTASCVLGAHGNLTRNDLSSDGVPYSMKLGFSLPVASDFSFFGNDSYSHGSFLIDAVESSSSDVEVDVVISYRTPRALKRSKVCLFEKGTERTIGIMNTNDDADPPSSATLLRYDVFVLLPVPEKRPLHISRLVADFMLFGIGIGDLAGRVEFGEINLTTGYKAIEVESLMAHKARLETSEAYIAGSYTTSSSLELLTKNWPIRADISMLNTGSSSHPPTQLTIRTTNSAISAQLNLSNPSSSSSFSDSAGVDGNFSITSTTTNAPLSLSVLSQPLSSFLQLSARTSNASAEVLLPPQFAGAFALKTSVLRPALEVSEIPPRDPARMGRWRQVWVTREEMHLLEGEVAWMDRRGRTERGGGLVDVRTTILPAILRL